METTQPSLGRFEFSSFVPGDEKATSCRFTSRRDADAAMLAFQRAHRLTPHAFAGIFDFETFRYVDKFDGGIVQGPRDDRHPMIRLAERALRAGYEVRIGGVIA